MRVRKKLMVLHTLFSLVLALTLIAALRPAVQQVVRKSERELGMLVLEWASRAAARGDDPADAPRVFAEAREDAPIIEVKQGSAEEVGLESTLAAAALAEPGTPIDAGERLVAWSPGEADGRFIVVRVVVPTARDAVMRLYIFLVIALLGVYALVAIALETLVLPQSVYEPIRRMLRADRAVQEGRPEDELVPESSIPADELGEIMRSRNDSIRKLRQHEAALAEALDQLEAVATDLKRKNHLLETAKRNLADADRLASLGMMSAGIAHELNTPLGVLKGLVERIERHPDHRTDARSAALMGRVVARLERLSESLLDFARAREPEWGRVALAEVVEEAMTLVRLDREAGGVEFENRVAEHAEVPGDADRLLQVLVNLVRNAADAVARSGRGGRVRVEAERQERDGTPWVALTVSDDGPGIDPALLSTLFEPFVSTRLDSRGTGLGLAVAEGIVREHGGVILARNRPAGAGAAFEVLLPAIRPPASNGAMREHD